MHKIKTKKNAKNVEPIATSTVGNGKGETSLWVGYIVGNGDGKSEGSGVGRFVGSAVGTSVGALVGRPVGLLEGSTDG